MIFALGSLIESKSDNSPYFNPQNLKSTAQAEQSIMTDSTSTPLIRLQAMLLSAMFALHAENTWRIAHISGVIMKFASLHRFHRLSRDAHDPANSMAIRVWSCAYVLDRAVSTALGTPVSLPDMYISSPLCEAIPEPESPVPWLSDCDSREEMAEPDLRTFAHICRVRSLQSFFMHMVEKEALEDSVPLELEMHMLNRLREWEDAEVIARHSVPNSDGYRSPVWLQHIGHLTRLSICFVNKANVFSSVADTALRAGCEACTSFRSLQKKKQIAQPWLVILSQFRAAVTLWYIRHLSLDVNHWDI
ncbi:C6 transcription factor [Pleurostoma richardsiae]|uniref:C6 transcription factor n=1 Tax=Pleurostoma richardsiae TaxID=41990 RepID=A0AA38VN34_9PEZI|nr:C6 transcription factor [Pleurostoma richardsiae]